MGNKNKSICFKSAFYGGLLGAILIVIIGFVIFTFMSNPFEEKPILLEYDVTSFELKEGVTKNDSIRRLELIDLFSELKSKNIILTPQEYTSQLGNYYSTLIAVLIGLFVAFTLFSVFSIRGLAKNEAIQAQLELDKREEKINAKVITYIKGSLKELLADSVSMQNIINTTITGKAEDIVKAEMRTLQELQETVSSLAGDIETMFEIINESQTSQIEIEEP